MLNEEQQAASVTLTGAQVVVALQVIHRLTSTGGLKDIELSPVGQARDGFVAALQDATGVNFDEARAQQEAMQRQRIAQAREAYAAQQAAAAENADAPEGDAETETVAETVADAEAETETEADAETITDAKSSK
jgi:hypothetical protein